MPRASSGGDTCVVAPISRDGRREGAILRGEPVVPGAILAGIGVVTNTAAGRLITGPHVSRSLSWNRAGAGEHVPAPTGRLARGAIRRRVDVRRRRRGGRRRRPRTVVRRG